MAYSFGGVKPVSPDEALVQQAMMIPDVVFEAVNNLLSKKALASSITIRKPDLVEEIQRLHGPTEAELYANRWLDVEPAYRMNGWDVEYEGGDWGDGPGYYTFRKRAKPNVPQPR